MSDEDVLQRQTVARRELAEAAEDVEAAKRYDDELAIRTYNARWMPLWAELEEIDVRLRLGTWPDGKLAGVLEGKEGWRRG